MVKWKIIFNDLSHSEKEYLLTNDRFTDGTTLKYEVRRVEKIQQILVTLCCISSSLLYRKPISSVKHSLI